MNVTYQVTADTILRAVDIAKQRASAEGWVVTTVVRTQQTGPREYEVHLVVSKHNRQ